MEFIKDLELHELETRIIELGLPKFRAKQIFKWLYLGVSSFDDMTNLSKDLREKLKEVFFITEPEIVAHQISKVDGTQKFLLKLHDGNTVECVLMQYKHGNTICVSCQVGCRMGCKFCASGLFGRTRNLNTSEILDQIIFIQKTSGLKISNIVLMGTGEPLDNFDNVIKFLKIVNHEDGLYIGHRHISVSTCGIVPRIYDLAKLKLQVTLSVSLHSPDNESRSSIMPINNSFNVETLVKACNDYFDTTKRRISYEYTLIDGVSDTRQNALKLVKLLAGRPAHVNLIPLNSVTESGLKTSNKKNIAIFQDILEKGGISATIRRTLGPDIDASCGQLRKREIGG